MKDTIQTLNELSTLILKTEGRRHHFYVDIHGELMVTHNDTSRALRYNIYSFLREFLPKGTEFRMWESTHSIVELPNNAHEYIIKTINKLNKKIKKQYQPMNGWEMRKDNTFSKTIFLKKDSKIKIIKQGTGWDNKSICILVSGYGSGLSYDKESQGCGTTHLPDPTKKINIGDKFEIDPYTLGTNYAPSIQIYIP